MGIKHSESAKKTIIMLDSCQSEKRTKGRKGLNSKKKGDEDLSTEPINAADRAVETTLCASKACFKMKAEKSLK